MYKNLYSSLLVQWTGDDADADIKCNQCDVSRNGGDCSFRGVCGADDKLCKCNTGYFGDACQFSGPCTEMAQHDEFHGLYNRGYQKTWELMYLNSKPVMVYDRPVYVQVSRELSLLFHYFFVHNNAKPYTLIASRTEH